MTQKVFISIMLMFVLLTGTASAELYVKVSSSTNIEKDSVLTSFLKSLTIQGSFIRTYTATPGQVFSMTYQNCPFQGSLGNNEVQSRITIVLNGVTVHDTGNVAVTPGICYTPVTVQVTAPSTPGTYSGTIKDSMTMEPYALTSNSYSFTLTVQAATPVATSVVLTPTSTSILTAGTYTLAANVYDQNGANMVVTPTWTTSNAAIATVNPSGVVTGISAGTATITASYGGKSSFSTITVTAPIITVTSVTVTPGINTIEIGTTKQLAAVIKDQNGAVITGTPIWSSNNPAAATVSSGGLVTGMSIGSSIVTATYNGKSGSAIFQVNAPGVVISPPTGWAAFLAALWAFLRTLFPFLPAQI